MWIVFDLKWRALIPFRLQRVVFHGRLEHLVASNQNITVRIAQTWSIWQEKNYTQESTPFYVHTWFPPEAYTALIVNGQANYPKLDPANLTRY